MRMYIHSNVAQRCCKQVSTSFQHPCHYSRRPLFKRLTRTKYWTVQNNHNKCSLQSRTNMTRVLSGISVAIEDHV